MDCKGVGGRGGKKKRKLNTPGALASIVLLLARARSARHGTHASGCSEAPCSPHCSQPASEEEGAPRTSSLHQAARGRVRLTTGHARNTSTPNNKLQPVPNRPSLSHVQVCCRMDWMRRFVSRARSPWLLGMMARPWSTARPCSAAAAPCEADTPETMAGPSACTEPRRSVMMPLLPPDSASVKATGYGRKRWMGETESHPGVEASARTDALRTTTMAPTIRTSARSSRMLR